jgi:hypothetical protein
MDFPIDIQNLIFKFFSSSELTIFRLVCRKWRDIIQELPVSISLQNLFPERFYKISDSFNNIQELELDFEELDIPDLKPILNHFLKLCNRLSAILCRKNCFTFHSLLNFIPNPQNLKRVKTTIVSSEYFGKLVNLEELT